MVLAEDGAELLGLDDRKVVGLNVGAMVSLISVGINEGITVGNAVGIFDGCLDEMGAEAPHETQLKPWQFPVTYIVIKFTV